MYGMYSTVPRSRLRALAAVDKQDQQRERDNGYDREQDVRHTKTPPPTSVEGGKKSARHSLPGCGELATRGGPCAEGPPSSAAESG